MEFNQQLVELFQGKINGVELGMPASHIEKILGKPDAIGGASRKYQWPPIWKYGGIEFHFDPKKRLLWLISTEFDFKPGIVPDSRNLNLVLTGLQGGMAKDELLRILVMNGFAYSEEPDNYNPGMVRIQVARACFLFGENSDPKGLISLSVRESV